MFKMIGRYWRKRQRQIDIDILWPTCKEQANNISHARGIFYIHCMMDEAWTRDYKPTQIVQIIEGLH